MEELGWEFHSVEFLGECCFDWLQVGVLECWRLV